VSTKKEDLLDAWGTFFVSHALAVRKIEKQIAGVSPLSLQEYDVLLTLNRAPGQKFRLAQLAEESMFTRSGISRVVKRLEQKNYLTRLPCQEDHRGAFAQLSAQGRKALQEAWKLYSHEILEIFNPAFTQTEARELKRLLEKIVQQVRPEPLIVLGETLSRGMKRKR